MLFFYAYGDGDDKKCHKAHTFRSAPPPAPHPVIFHPFLRIINTVIISSLAIASINAIKHSPNFLNLNNTLLISLFLSHIIYPYYYQPYHQKYQR